MKKRIVRTVLAMITSVMMVGCNTMTVGNEVEQTEQATLETMATIQAEQNNIQFDSVEVYHTTNQKEFDDVTEILENRKGKIIIKVVNGTVLDDDGNGTDTLGNYISYDSSRFSKGDKVQSVFVYNPESNSIDDILYRTDTLTY